LIISSRIIPFEVRIPTGAVFQLLVDGHRDDEKRFVADERK
jgi:hypothetical protein